MAMSPRMAVGPEGHIDLAVDFYMEGNQEYPSYLKVRRTTSYTWVLKETGLLEVSCDLSESWDLM